MQINIVYFIFIALIMVVSCAKKSERQRLELENIDLKYNSFYNTIEFRDLCDYIITSEIDYSPSFLKFEPYTISDEFLYTFNNRHNELLFHKVGLKVGDVLLQINELKVRETADVRKVYLLLKSARNSILKFVILRGNMEKLIEIPIDVETCKSSSPAHA